MRGSGHGGGGGGSWAAYTRLETSQSAREVAEHYAGQLRTAGWTVGAPAQGEGVIVYRGQRKDDDNRDVYGVLTVIEIPVSPRQIDVAFRIERAEFSR